MGDESSIQYGCGKNAPKTWRNFDASPTLRIQNIPIVGNAITASEKFTSFPKNVEYGDIISGLPIKSDSAEVIYCSHVLEHLALKDFRTALRNTYNYLLNGGIFRLVVPDLERQTRKYMTSNDPKSAHEFMRSTLLGQETRPRGIEAIARQIFGNSSHRWMWDYSALKFELRKAGFEKIRRAEYGDSESPRFSEVEKKERWEGSLGVECKKT